MSPDNLKAFIQWDSATGQPALLARELRQQCVCRGGGGAARRRARGALVCTALPPPPRPLAACPLPHPAPTCCALIPAPVQDGQASVGGRASAQGAPRAAPRVCA